MQVLISTIDHPVATGKQSLCRSRSEIHFTPCHDLVTAHRGGTLSAAVKTRIAVDSRRCLGAGSWTAEVDVTAEVKLKRIRAAEVALALPECTGPLSHARAPQIPPRRSPRHVGAVHLVKSCASFIL